MALNVSGKLQPQILKAIDSIVKNGVYEMTANMVKDRCIYMNSSVNWSGRLPAICNGMRNTSACGAIIISEDRDFGGFTIRFDAEGNPNIPIPTDISNYLTPLIKSLKESNKTPNKTVKSKMTQAEFIDNLVDTLHVFSPEGRKRICKDLTHVNTQLLCLGQLNGQPLKGVTAFGKPNRILIENRIIDKYSKSTYIDDGIKWNLTSGVNFELKETKKSVKLIICFYQNFIRRIKTKCLLKPY